MAIYLGDGLLLTCAHIVASALGKLELMSDTDPPDEQVRIHFFRTDNVTKNAEIASWYRYIADEEARNSPRPGLSDIALLRLDESAVFGRREEPAIFAYTPPSLDPSALRFYGNTTTKPLGSWFTAGHNGGVEKGRYALVMTEGGSNIVEPGCSGSLVFDRIYGRCVGMIDARLEGGDTAYMIPTEILMAACDEIQPEPPQNEAKKERFRHAQLLLDRRRERRRMEKQLSLLLEKKNLRPVICTLFGNIQSEPESLAHCFVQDTFRQVLDPSLAQADLVFIGPSLGFDSNDLRLQLTKHICFREEILEPQVLADELNKSRQVLTVATRINIDDFEEPEDEYDLTEVLKDYLGFLRELGRFGINAPFFQFFLIESDDIDWNEERGNKVYKIIESSCSQDGSDELEGPIAEGPLGMVPKRELLEFVTVVLDPLFEKDPGFDPQALKRLISDSPDKDIPFTRACILLDQHLSKVLANE